jgi:hypothetical protein
MDPDNSDEAGAEAPLQIRGRQPYSIVRKILYVINGANLAKIATSANPNW